MSRRNPHTDEEGVAEAAATWFVRLQGETASEQDWQAFEAWLSAAPAHVAAYEKIERLWMALDADAPALAAALEAPQSAPRRARPRHPQARVSRRVWLGVGGAMAASVALGVVFLAQGPEQAPASLYRTAAGQTQIIKLADGTQVRLNAASSLKVRLGRDARRVEMAEGEAAFDVTHDPKRPFLIAVGDNQVKVVGTEFDIRHRGGSTELTVRRGVVEVRPGAAEAAAYKVAAGQQYARRDGATAATITDVSANDAFAWTEGQLVYRDRPLSEVAADLSRRFGRPVTTADARTAALRFTGVLVTDNEPAVIRRLEGFAPVTAEQTADGVVLRAR
jgi:transmembrane sensor